MSRFPHPDPIMHEHHRLQQQQQAPSKTLPFTLLLPASRPRFEPTENHPRCDRENAAAARYRDEVTAYHAQRAKRVEVREKLSELVERAGARKGRVLRWQAGEERRRAKEREKAAEEEYRQRWGVDYFSFDPRWDCEG
ncbi:MAG: hypothetical protein HETSPECPRED_002121 [Heterodermia speciosa]|uniref:Uncharacterized protein n=1 Tax=Heterodermia speciosa TaxID=116794 RepID=A0A8H3PGT5_9LECA|nr:MAG: hypothetical protein HETSPECPRED_002121 [Heterodermia speciosa]